MRLSMRLGSAAAVTFCVATVPVWGQENPLPDLFSDVIDVRVVNGGSRRHRQAGEPDHGTPAW